MKPKTGVYGPRKKVTYTESQWTLLEDLRSRAREVMGWLENRGIHGIIHGSVARGDVNQNSDVDIFILSCVPSFMIETAIPEEILDRKIVQATPGHLIKGVYVLQENTTITFPLVKPKRREIEFYYFGGALGFRDLKKRVPGVDKRLMLVLPDGDGHEEIPLEDMPFNHVAGILGITMDVIEERVRILKRRGEIGRTGVFIDVSLHPDESIERKLREIAGKNPLIKSELKRRGGRI